MTALRTVRSWLRVLVTTLLAAPGLAQTIDPAAIGREIDATELNVSGAVALEEISLRAGLARFTLQGKLIPASAVGGTVAELVFLGNGRIELTPPDDVEASQLELFTGARELDETFTQAVIVVTMDQAAAALLAGTPSPLAAGEREQAQAAWEKWKSAGRRQAAAPSALWADAMGDAAASGYFAARCHGTELGEFLYLFDPSSREQVILGRFEPLDASKRAKREIERIISRQQRQGRLVGLDVDRLGQFDTWLSASDRQQDQVAPGGENFEPVQYRLNVDVNLDDEKGTLSGTAAITLQSVIDGARTFRLRLSADYEIDSISADGQPLATYRSERDIVGVLPAPAASGDRIEIVVTYRGTALVETRRGFALSETGSWYPHAGDVDRAAYDATFSWPEPYVLLAPGTRAEAGQHADGRQWARYVLERPTLLYSFEIGRYKVETRQVGHVALTVAFDPVATRMLGSVREEIVDTAALALTEFEKTFGPYPLDQLTLVTVSRPFSQALLGFVTLSNQMMGSRTFFLEDRRTVIAHEIAHQWFGHQIGWESYRDSWLSESLANYAAVVYQQRHLAAETLRGPTAGWQDYLTRSSVDGRVLESLGPVTLGGRLSSSRGDAMVPIIYQKGALILDMLGRGFGRDRFPAMLREIARQTDGRRISTVAFFESLERLSGTQLDAFERRFVFGTGLPEVYYSHRTVPDGPGKWKVEGEASLRSPYRFNYRVVASGSGYDVRRERRDVIDNLDELWLTVPAAVSFHDKGKADESPNALMNTHVRLVGARTTFSIPTAFEPRGLYLDRQREVFGRFFDASKFPKHTLLLHANDAIAAGDATAGTLLQQALASPLFAGADADNPYRSAKRETEFLDVDIRVAQARLALDGGRLDDAEAALQAARDIDKSVRWASEFRVLEARIASRKGDYAAVLDRLRDRLLAGTGSTRLERSVLRAIAARMTGDSKTHEAAVKTLRTTNVDFSALPAAPN